MGNRECIEKIIDNILIRRGYTIAKSYSHKPHLASLPNDLSSMDNFF